MLVTSDHNLNDIHVWDIYNQRDLHNANERDQDEADYNLHVPDTFEIDNFRWSNNSFKLYAAMTEETKRKEHILCVYDLEETQKDITLNKYFDESIRMTKPKKNRGFAKPKDCLPIPMGINYLALDDKDHNRIYGTSDSEKFVMDIRDPFNYNIFSDKTRDDPLNLLKNKNTTSDLMVEYNQNNNVIFVDRLQKEIYIYDVRKVS